jgi:ABC-type phosphate transport system auxiliary subunit
VQQEQKDAAAQLAALTRACAEAREREAALDAELRLSRGTQQESQEQLEEQLESARADVRKLQADAQIASDSAQRAEARATELQAVVDSLGRERAALRSEAGAMRARVELLAATDERSRRLAAELDELRGENEFLNQELARANSPRNSAPPPLPSKG